MSKLVTNTSSAETKIALFRSLFQGKEDVYPVRFENRKTGRRGHASSCGNEWVRGLCEKSRIKGAACPRRKFLPVTVEVIRRHLFGMDAPGRPFVTGVYPMLLDETCRLLALNLDGDEWSNPAQAILGTRYCVGVTYRDGVFRRLMSWLHSEWATGAR